jgi:hypothetical protein
VNRHTLPPAPILVITAFGIVRPETKFKLDVFGRGVSRGQTVTNPAAFASVTVRFNTTADSSAGAP